MNDVILTVYDQQNNGFIVDLYGQDKSLGYQLLKTTVTYLACRVTSI
jgi:hypothetical protein